MIKIGQTCFYLQQKSLSSIQKELKIVPRYAKKIDIDSLQSFLDLAEDEETLAYQKNIIEFLKNLKEETLEK